MPSKRSSVTVTVGKRLNGTCAQFLTSDAASLSGDPVHPRAQQLTEVLRRFTATPLVLPSIDGPSTDAAERELPPLAELTATCLAEMHFLLPTTTLTAHELSTALLTDPNIGDNPARRAWAASIAVGTPRRCVDFCKDTSI